MATTTTLSSAAHEKFDTNEAKSSSRHRVFKRDRDDRVKAFRRDVDGPELRCERHGKAPCVGGGNQFFGIGPFAVFKTRDEGIRRVGKHSALGRDFSSSVFERAVPYRCRDRKST